MNDKRQGPAAQTPRPDRKETLARDIYTGMLSNGQWAAHTLRHVAAQAIEAAATFYEVLDNGMEN